jgi:hypothetical protein
MKEQKQLKSRRLLKKKRKKITLNSTDNKISRKKNTKKRVIS